MTVDEERSFVSTLMSDAHNIIAFCVSSLFPLDKFFETLLEDNGSVSKTAAKASDNAHLSSK